MSLARSTEPDEELQSLLERVRNRERTALKRTVAYSLIPIIIAVVVLGFVSWQIKVADQQLMIAKLRLNDANQQVQLVNKEVENAKNQLVAIRQELNVTPGAPGAVELRKLEESLNMTAKGLNALSENLSGLMVAFNTPKELRLGEVARVELHVSPPEEISRGVIVGTPIEANLSGSGFMIEALTHQTQTLAKDAVTVWYWEIEPTRAGIQSLHLTLSALLWIEGEQRNLTIRTFVIDIEVEPRQSGLPDPLEVFPAHITQSKRSH